MSADVALELDATSVTAGASLSGAVVVDVRRDCWTDGVWVELCWRTEGEGNRDRGEPVRVRLQPPRRWSRGDRHRLPFRLPVPTFPVTYHGELLRVVWLVSAGADVRWDAEAPVEREVTVVAGPATRAQVAAHVAALGLQGAEKARLALTQCGVAGLVALVVGILLLGVGAPVVVPLLVAALGAFGAVLGLRNKAAELLLGDVELELTERAAAGDAIDVRFSFTPARSLEVHAVTAVLVGTERVRRTNGEETRVRTHELSRVPVELLGADLVGDPRRLEVSGQVPIPPRAAPSFKSANNEVKWYVELRVDIPGWPDWTLDVEVAVLPAPSSAPPTVQLRSTARIRVQAGQRCPYCRDELARGGHLETCAGCQTVYHADCYAELGSCATRGCRQGRSRWRA